MDHFFTHCFTHSVTRSFIHSLSHPLTHSFSHSLVLTYSLTHLLTYSLTHSLIHSLIHSLLHSLTHSLTSLSHSHKLILCFSHQIRHSLTHSLSLTLNKLLKSRDLQDSGEFDSCSSVCRKRPGIVRSAPRPSARNHQTTRAVVHSPHPQIVLYQCLKLQKMLIHYIIYTFNQCILYINTNSLKTLFHLEGVYLLKRCTLAFNSV